MTGYDITIRTPQIGGRRRIVEAVTAAGSIYLRRFGQHMDLVSFGEGGPTPHLCVDFRRVPALTAHMETQGLVWGRV